MQRPCTEKSPLLTRLHPLNSGKMKWLIVIGILLGWSLYPVTGDLWAAQAERVEKELTEKKEEFKRIEKKLRLKEKEKEDILRKESSIRKGLDRTEKYLHKREKIVKQKKAGLEQMQRRMRDTENQIFILARDVKQTEDGLSSDLQTLYKLSRVPLEAYLFSLSSGSDLLKMDKYLCVLVEHHAQLTKAYKHELALKRSDERKLVWNRIQWQLSISEEEKKKEKVRKLRNAEQARLKAMVNQKAISQLRLKRRLELRSAPFFQERSFMPIGSKNLGIPSS